MKSLNTILNEGLADWDEGDFEKSIKKETSKTAIKKHIIDWIVSKNINRTIKSRIKIDTTTEPWTVNYDEDISLYGGDRITNGMFQWGNVKLFYIDNSSIDTLEDCPKEVEDFYCKYCDNLKDLKGAPKTKETFRCSNCKNLESLEGCPEKVCSFDCSNCPNLKSLKYGPKYIQYDYKCSGCKSLIDLEGVPEIINWNFYCSNCQNLKSLKGGPKEITGNFHCNDCKNLESLKGAPEKIRGNFDCDGCEKLKSLDGLKWVNCDILCRRTQITSIPKGLRFDGRILDGNGQILGVNNKIW